MIITKLLERLQKAAMLTNEFLTSLKLNLAKRESEGSGGYTAIYPKNSPIDKAKALGKYQFIPSTIRLVASLLSEATPSNLVFLSNPALQERYMDALLISNYNQLQNQDLLRFIGTAVKSQNTGKFSGITLSGLLAGAHLGGITNLKEFLLYGKDAKDANGTYISEYVQHFSGIDVQSGAGTSLDVTALLGFLSLLFQK